AGSGTRCQGGCRRPTTAEGGAAAGQPAGPVDLVLAAGGDRLSLPPIPSQTAIRSPNGRTLPPMRRVVFGLALLGLLLAGVPAIQAAPLDDARRRQQALRAEGQQATAELQAAEAALARATDQLAYDQGQLTAAGRQQRTARAALAGQAAAMYRSGGLAIADALLDRDPALVPGRVEMATVLVSRNAQLIEDAQVTGDAYRSVLGRVTKGAERARALRDQARAAVAKLTSGLEEAKAVEARLVRLEQRRKAGKVPPGPARRRRRRQRQPLGQGLHPGPPLLLRRQLGRGPLRRAQPPGHRRDGTLRGAGVRLRQRAGQPGGVPHQTRHPRI